MLSSRIRALGAVAGLILAAVALTPTKAAATTYTYTETVDPTTEKCTSPGNCYIILQGFSPFFGTSSGPTLKMGDIVDLNVTFSTPFTVDGATGVSAIYGALVDTNYYNCLGLNPPACIMPETSDLATSTETVLGENSGGPTLVTGNNFSFPGFYSAFAYVNGPNPGFTVTGFDATLTMVNGDPSPIEAVAVESLAINVPEPRTIVLAFAELGLLFALRKRFRLGVGQVS